MKTYLVTVWCQFNPKTGKFCNPYFSRTMRIRAISFDSAITAGFVGNTEFVGRIYEEGTDNFVG